MLAIWKLFILWYLGTDFILFKKFPTLKIKNVLYLHVGATVTR